MTQPILQEEPPHKFSPADNYVCKSVLNQNTYKFNISCLNINGFNTFYNLNNAELDCLKDSHVMCFVETWISDKAFKLPNLFNEYEMYVSEAIKTHTRGRASGGIMILIHKNLSESVLIEISRYWLFVGIKINKLFLIIGTIYLPPLCDIETCLEQLHFILVKIHNKFPEGYIVLYGDFNCRVGNLNTLEDDVFENTSLYGLRTVMDSYINRRGKLLAELMETLGFFLCNGRSITDRPANFTYVSKIGKSTIDLVWINEPLFTTFYDMSVTPLSPVFDHLLCTVTFMFSDPALSKVKNKKENTCNLVRHIKWDSSRVPSFQFFLTRSDRIYFNSKDNTSLYNNFVECMHESLTNSGLLFYRNQFKEPKKTNQKWFDKECEFQKSLVCRK